jgi:hypothetical protein
LSQVAVQVVHQLVLAVVLVVFLIKLGVQFLQQLTT